MGVNRRPIRHTGKVQPILRLSWGVCVVENNQNGSYPGGGKEHGGVLFAVARHNAHPVADANARLQQGGRQQPAVVVKLVVRPSRACPGDDNAFSVAVVQALQVEQLSQRQIDQRRVCWAEEEGRSLWPGEDEALWLNGDLGRHGRSGWELSALVQEGIGACLSLLEVQKGAVSASR